MEFVPSAEIDGRRQQQRPDQRRIDRPRSHECVESGIHGCLFPPIGCSARPSGWFCRRLSRWSQTRKEVDECRHLRGADLLSISGHLAAPRRSLRSRRSVADLVNQLVPREAHSDQRQIRPPSAADALQRMTIPAILVLKHDRALQHQRRAAFDDRLGNRFGTPGVHHGRPGGRIPLVSQNAQDRVDHNDRKDGDGAAARRAAHRGCSRTGQGTTPESEAAERRASRTSPPTAD